VKQKALIVEPTRLFQKLVEQIMNVAGVECCIYSTGKEALEASHDEYTFILISKTLADISGEIFLQLYGVKHGLGQALPIMLTSSEVDEVMPEANKAGYKHVFNKKDKCFLFHNKGLPEICIVRLISCFAAFVVF